MTWSSPALVTSATQLLSTPLRTGDLAVLWERKTPLKTVTADWLARTKTGNERFHGRCGAGAPPEPCVAVCHTFWTSWSRRVKKMVPRSREAWWNPQPAVLGGHCGSSEGHRVKPRTLPTLHNKSAHYGGSKSSCATHSWPEMKSW